MLPILCSIDELKEVGGRVKALYQSIEAEETAHDPAVIAERVRRSFKNVEEVGEYRAVSIKVKGVRIVPISSFREVSEYLKQYKANLESLIGILNYINSRLNIGGSLIYVNTNSLEVTIFIGLRLSKPLIDDLSLDNLMQALSNVMYPKVEASMSRVVKPTLSKDDVDRVLEALRMRKGVKAVGTAFSLVAMVNVSEDFTRIFTTLLNPQAPPRQEAS